MNLAKSLYEFSGQTSTITIIQVAPSTDYGAYCYINILKPLLLNFKEIILRNAINNFNLSIDYIVSS